MRDNKFFENSTRGRRAYKSATSSHRLPRFLIRRRQAYRRKAGKSKELHPPACSRGEQQDTLRTAGEKSTPAVDLKQLYRANRRPASLLCRPCPTPIPDPGARNLQSRAATPRVPSVPDRQRLG